MCSCQYNYTSWQTCTNTHTHIHTHTHALHITSLTPLAYQRGRQYLPTCGAIYHCGPGTALQGLRLWTRWASQGEGAEFARAVEAGQSCIANSGNERWLGLLGSIFLFLSVFPSLHPAPLLSCSLRHKEKIMLD